MQRPKWELPVLEALKRGAKTQQELADELGLHPFVISGVLERLERRGLIVREAADKRVKFRLKRDIDAFLDFIKESEPVYGFYSVWLVPPEVAKRLAKIAPKSRERAAQRVLDAKYRGVADAFSRAEALIKEAITLVAIELNLDLSVPVFVVGSREEVGKALLRALVRKKLREWAKAGAAELRIVKKLLEVRAKSVVESEEVVEERTVERCGGVSTWYVRRPIITVAESLAELFGVNVPNPLKQWFERLVADELVKLLNEAKRSGGGVRNAT